MLEFVPTSTMLLRLVIESPADMLPCRDHAQLEKMRQLGMKPEDEFKLSMMREYISKLAISRQACVHALFAISRWSLTLTCSLAAHHLGSTTPATHSPNPAAPCSKI